MKIGARKASGKGPVVKIAIAVAVVLGVGAGWHFLRSASPQDVVKTYMTALDKGDGKAAGECVIEKDRGKVERWAGGPMAVALKGLGYGATYRYGETTFKEGTATVALTGTLSAEVSKIAGVAELPFPYVLTKEGRQWRIDLSATQLAQVQAQRVEIAGQSEDAAGEEAEP